MGIIVITHKIHIYNTIQVNPPIFKYIDAKDDMKFIIISQQPMPDPISSPNHPASLSSPDPASLSYPDPASLSSPDPSAPPTNNAGLLSSIDMCNRP